MLAEPPVVPDDVLVAEGVVKRYGGVSALEGVSLRAAAGECVALVGESGSGKTTLLRCFNRMTEPDGGRVTVEGVDAAATDAVELRRRIGYVQQEGGLLPHWTVLRNTSLVPWLRGDADAEAKGAAALAWVGLDAGEFARAFPGELAAAADEWHLPESPVGIAAGIDDRSGQRAVRPGPIDRKSWCERDPTACSKVPTSFRCPRPATGRVGPWPGFGGGTAPLAIYMGRKQAVRVDLPERQLWLIGTPENLVAEGAADLGLDDEGNLIDTICYPAGETLSVQDIEARDGNVAQNENNAVIALDKTDATRVLTRIRRQWFNKRKSISALLREVLYNQPSQLLDSDADNKVVDADLALQAPHEMAHRAAAHVPLDRDGSGARRDAQR